MSLATELSRTVETVRSAVPEPIFEAIGRSIADLGNTGIAEQATKVGERIEFPVLERIDGSPLPLAQTLGGRPAVLLFYRGGWCPYCNVTLRAYASALPDIEAAGGTLVAITPELADRAVISADSNAVDFAIGIDRGNAFARSLGLVFALPDDLRPLYRQIGIDLATHNGDDSHELPIPAVYVVDDAGTVRWAHLDADFTRRADPQDVVEALRSLQASASALAVR